MMCHARGLGLAGNQALEMGKRIFFGARRSPRRGHDLSRDDIEIDEPG